MDFLPPFLIMKKYLYILGILIVTIIISFYIGNSIGKKTQKDKEITGKIKIIHSKDKKAYAKIDSLYDVIKNINSKNIPLKKEENSLRKKAKDYKIPIVDNKDCDTVYSSYNNKISLLEKALNTKDTIENNLNKVIISKDSIIVYKDNIIKNKTEEIKLIKELNKPRSKKLSLSLQLGTGGQINIDKKNINVQRVPVYVGIGVSYKIFEF